MENTDTLFDTPQKKQLAVKTFTELAHHPGWVLFCRVLNIQIEALQFGLSSDAADTIEEVQRLRNRLSIYKEVIGLPQEKIKEFTEEEEGIFPSLDPFPQQ